MECTDAVAFVSAFDPEECPFFVMPMFESTLRKAMKET